MASARAVVVWVIVIVFASVCTSSQAQAPQPHTSITTENASQVRQIAMLGRGGIYRLLWSPDGTILVALGSNGIWLYDAMDWGHPPVLLGENMYSASIGAFDLTGRLLVTNTAEGWQLWDIQEKRLMRTVTKTRPSGISTIIFSPNQHYIVTGGSGGYYDGSGLLQIWEVNTGKEIAYYHAENIFKWIQDLVFSPDGEYLLISALMSDSKYAVYTYRFDDLLDIPNQASPISIHQQSDYAEVNNVYYTAQAKAAVWVRTFGDKGIHYELRLLSEDETLVEVLHPQTSHITDAYDVNFTQEMMAFDTPSGDIEIYGFLTPNPIKTLSGHQEVYTLALSPDGKQVASYVDGKYLIVWDLDSQTEKIISDEHTQFGYTVKFQPNGDILALGTEINDGEIQLWDVSLQKMIGVLEGSGGWTAALDFNLDGNLLVSVGGLDGEIKVWDMTEGEIHTTIQVQTSVNQMFFAPDDTNIVSISEDENTTIFSNLETSRITATFYQEDTYALNAAGIVSDGRYLLTTNANDVLYVWDIAAQSEIEEYSGQYFMPNLTVSSDGQLFASSNSGNIVTLWYGETLQPIKSFSAVSNYIGIMAFSPDNSLLAAIGSGERLMIFDINRGKLVLDIPVVDGLLYSLDWSSDSTKIALTGRGGAIFVMGVPQLE